MVTLHRLLKTYTVVDIHQFISGFFKKPKKTPTTFQTKTNKKKTNQRNKQKKNPDEKMPFWTVGHFHIFLLSVFQTQIAQLPGKTENPQ